jgi:hypothetical protein
MIDTEAAVMANFEFLASEVSDQYSVYGHRINKILQERKQWLTLNILLLGMSYKYRSLHYY